MFDDATPAPTPSPTGDNGRARNGRFTAGNRVARGNPLNARVQRIRAELLRSASPADVKAICKALVDGAKGGDLTFIKEWLDRTCGKSVPADLEQRMSEIETQIIRIRAVDRSQRE